MLNLESKINEKKDLLYALYRAIKRKNNGPIKWGRKQNEEWDGLLNVYEIDTYKQFLKGLESRKTSFNTIDEWKKWCQYSTKRITIRKFSDIDELLFQKYGATPNPIQKSKKWDFIAHGIAFDLKSSKVFEEEHEIINKIINETIKISDFSGLGVRMYKAQSGYDKKNGRYSLNNRLFLLHVSENGKECITGEEKLRLNFNIKEEAIKYFMRLEQPIIHEEIIDGIRVLFTFLIIYENNKGIIKYYNA